METPRGSRTLVPVSQASPRKLAEMDNGFALASPQHQASVQQQMNQIIVTLRDPNEDRKAREASAYAMLKTLEIVASEQNFDFDLEIPGQPADNNNAGPQTIDQTVHQRPEQTRNQPQQGRGANGTLFNGEAVDLGGVHPWKKALDHHNCVQGNGLTEANPIYIGATTNTQAPPDIEVAMDLGLGMSATFMRDGRIQLYLRLRALRWHGSKNKSKLYMKLHPWACEAWCNFFVGLALGPTVISKLNAILKAADPARIKGPSQQDAARARALSVHGSLTQIERRFYGSLSTVITYRSSKHNAYTRYREIVECATLGDIFKQMEQEIVNNPQGDLRRSLERQNKQGCNDRNALFRACAESVGMNKDELVDTVERHNVLTQCAKALGRGFLLLVTTQMITLYRNNGRSCIDHILPIVLDIFPNYQALCEALQRNIGNDLLSYDPANNMKLSQKKIDSSDGAADLISRLIAMRQG